MKKITINLSFVILLLTFFSQNLAAQKCMRNIFKREGTVHAGGPASMKFTATSQKVEIKLTKTAGRADAHLNITYKRCAQCVVVNERIAFDFDEANSTKTLVIENVLEDRLTMSLVSNANVSRSFSYKIRVNARSENALAITENNAQVHTFERGAVGVGKMTQNYYTLPSCSGMTYIRVRPKDGRAEATVKIFEEDGVFNNGKTNWKQLDIGAISQHHSRQEFEKIINSTKMLKIEVRQSTSPSFGLSFSVLADFTKYATVSLHNNNGVAIKGK